VYIIAGNKLKSYININKYINILYIMPQKKKQNKKEKKPKTTRKPHSKQVKTTIIQQAIPNYSSGQMTGHQYNKDHVQFAQQQQQSKPAYIRLI
jgi:hypothetical protein